jgi:NMT1/THI5 like
MQYRFAASSVRIVNVPFNARVAALLSGEADFASAWYGSGLVQLGSILAKAGTPFTFIRWSDHRIDIHGQCLAAKVQWLQENSTLTGGG